MPSTYLPMREGELDAWLANFAEKIATPPGPGAYGLIDADAAEIAAAVAAWHEAFIAAIEPGTRTRPAVAAKNAAKAAVLKIVRRYGATIRANPGVDSALKIVLGLHVRRADKPGGGGSPIPAPETAPTITVTGLSLGGHTLRVLDSTTTTRRVRPAGAAGLMLFRAVGESPATHPSQAGLLAMVTRTRYESRFEHAQQGRIATYFGRWVSAKGEFGPWSTPASMPIAA